MQLVAVYVLRAFNGPAAFILSFDDNHFFYMHDCGLYIEQKVNGHQYSKDNKRRAGERPHNSKEERKESGKAEAELLRVIW